MLPAPGLGALFFGGASYPSRREGKRGGLGEREPSERCDRTRRILFEDLSMLFILHRIDWDSRYRAWARARPHSSSPPTASARCLAPPRGCCRRPKAEAAIGNGRADPPLTKKLLFNPCYPPTGLGGSTPRLAFVQPTCKPDGRRPSGTMRKEGFYSPTSTVADRCY